MSPDRVLRSARGYSSALLSLSSLSPLSSLFILLSHLISLIAHLSPLSALIPLTSYPSHVPPLPSNRGYLEESINTSTTQTALALQHICWSRSATETGRILGTIPEYYYRILLHFYDSNKLLFYFFFTCIYLYFTCFLLVFSFVFTCIYLYLFLFTSFTSFTCSYLFVLVLTAFLGERISECVLCTTGVDLAYRTYFRVLSELLLSGAVEVRFILVIKMIKMIAISKEVFYLTD